MVDDAVSPDGDDRFEHVLVKFTSARLSIRIQNLGLYIVSLCTLLFSVACDSGPSASNSLNTQAPVPAIEMDWRSLLNSLPTDDTTLPAVALPADIRTHATQTGESFEARWALTNNEGESYSAFAQLDRLRLKEAVDSESSWSYDSIARASVAVGGANDPVIKTWEIFSRVALGLAESRGDAFVVGSTALSLGKDNSCTRDIRFSHDKGVINETSFSATSSRCPHPNSLGTVNQWEFAGIPTVGVVAGEKVEGVLWLTHRWGTSTLLQSAVVLDQLRLVVTDNQGILHHVNITRSKRRSGRGPKTVLATITQSQGPSREAAVDWTDVGDLVSPVTGIAYPTTIRIREQSLGLDIILSPVVKLSEVRDSLQTRWTGALDIEGTHSGFAYLDFLPVKKGDND